MLNIAIFVSGRGTNMEALIKASVRGEVKGEVSVVFCNNPEAAAIDIARSYNIPVEIIDHRKFSSREAFDLEMLSRLKGHSVDLICLAGFMRVLTSDFLKDLSCPIINIHPSLLPDFKGADAVKDAFDAGVEKTGCTVHYVIPEMDAGEIIVQREVIVDKNDSLDGLKNKILKEEHIAYIEAINKVAN